MDYGKLGSVVIVPAPPGFSGVVEGFERYWVDSEGHLGFGTGTPMGELIPKADYDRLTKVSYQNYMDTRFEGAFDAPEESSEVKPPVKVRKKKIE